MQLGTTILLQSARRVPTLQLGTTILFLTALRGSDLDADCLYGLLLSGTLIRCMWTGNTAYSMRGAAKLRLA